MTVLNSLDLDGARYFIRPDLVPNCLQMWLINRWQQSTLVEKIVTSIMPLELLESPELDYIHFWCIYRGGSRDFWKGCSYV